MKTQFKALAAATLMAVSAGSAMAADEQFEASITLLAPLSIVEGQNLSFEPTLAGQAVDVVTAPADTRAAVFSATGNPNSDVVGSVVENDILVITGGGSPSERLKVDTFTLGGDMDAAGKAQFNGQGQLSNLRVGGTAHVKANNVPGDYTGTATFRLVYF